MNKYKTICPECGKESTLESIAKHDSVKQYGGLYFQCNWCKKINIIPVNEIKME